MRKGVGLIAAAVALAGLSGTAAGIGTAHAQVNTANRDAVKNDNIQPEVAIRKRTGRSASAYAYPKTSFAGNQRQYRKKMRSNPCRYASKKHRANN